MRGQKTDALVALRAGRGTKNPSLGFSFLARREAPQVYLSSILSNIRSLSSILSHILSLSSVLSTILSSDWHDPCL
ncbi:MAG: hypothetical protein LBD06_05435 [Candidatus Accumulibacter sp.]|nr:hypothetical protein [Accumulibacter sp.]